MLAIVKISGNQFKIEVGKNIIIPHLEATQGEKIEFKDILFIENEGKITIGNTDNKTVKAEVIKHFSGDKVIAFKMKRRKGFRKKKGHRTQYTQIKINEII